MISPSFILGQDSVRLYDMVTSAVCTYGVGEFVSAPSLVPSRRYKLSEADFFSELVLLKDKLVGVSHRPDAPCYMFNAAGQKIGAVGNSPRGPEAIQIWNGWMPIVLFPLVMGMIVLLSVIFLLI